MSADFQFDVFLSHSSKDKPVVRELAARLRQDGVRVWLDEEQIKPGHNIPAKIEEGLEKSRVLVLCMSAHAFGSDWAQLEAGTFRFRDPLNKERRFIPLRLDDAPINGSLAQFLYINWRIAANNLEYTKLLEACRDQTKGLTPTNAEGQNTDIEMVGNAPGPFSEANEARNYFLSHFFPIANKQESPQPTGTKVAIIDDEPILVELAGCVLSSLGLNCEEYSDPELFLKQFAPRKYAVIISDYAMCPLTGTDLLREVCKIERDIPFIIFSGTINEKEAANILGDISRYTKNYEFVEKPYDPKQFVEAVMRMLNANQHPPHKWMNANHYDLYLHTRQAAVCFQEILGRMSRHDDLAHQMLRHSAKYEVRRFIDSVQPSAILSENMSFLKARLRSLERLSRRVKSAERKEFLPFLTDILNDLQVEFNRVIFKLSSNEAAKMYKLPSSQVAILTLIISELVENAIDAMKKAGEINISISYLATRSAMHITVQDSGPGVPDAAERKIFSEGFSTKGNGRGLGLYLIRESLKKLGGTISFENRSGAFFAVFFPCDFR